MTETESRDRDDLTELLRRALTEKSPADDEQAVAIVWQQLRARAAQRLRSERRNHTLQPTDLANECFLALKRMDSLRIVDRARFFSLVGRILDNVLKAHARKKQAKKRVQARRRVPLTDSPAPDATDVADLLDLGSALEWLETALPEEREVLERRFFDGQTYDQIAAALGLSATTARERVACAILALLRWLER